MKKYLIAGAVFLGLSGLGFTAETVEVSTTTVGSEKYVLLETFDTDPVGTKYLKRTPELIRVIDFISKIERDNGNLDQRVSSLSSEIAKSTETKEKNNILKQKALNFLAQ